MSAPIHNNNNNNNKTPESIHRLDLSYLHRCGTGDIAAAIRGTLEQQQKEQQQSTQTEDRTTTTAAATTATEEEETDNSVATVLDIDLTASLIGKNISEIISSLKRPDHHREQDTNNTAAATVRSSVVPSMMVRLTARRNRLSPVEATALVDFVLENNGPSNETTTTTTTTIDEDKGEQKGKDEKGTPAASSGEDSGSLAEIAATEASEETEPSGNSATAATTATSNLSTILSNVDADSNGGLQNHDNASAAAATSMLRPAFVSIQSLDLGWNNLGSSSSSSSSSSNTAKRSSAAGVRTVNRALRRLLADPEKCPTTIRLDVCGLGPPACRDVAKGIVERFQARSGLSAKDDKENEEVDGPTKTQARALPPPLSLDLACNEGIGDVGVAALAAAIRTVAPQDGLVNRNPIKRETKKKRRRKKRRSSNQQQQQQQQLSQEGGKAGNNTEDEEEEDTMEETNIDTDKTDGKSSAVEAVASGTTPRTILERLDLSGCGIGDVGAEALAIALTNHPLCVKHLDLSNNRISDQGARALARALGMRDSGKRGDGVASSSAGLVETLDLSHNKDLGDLGAKELADAFERGGISKLILRSCNVRADGAASFGTALRSLTPLPIAGDGRRLIDLSGNPLGILSKKKKSGNKYSATALRSKATDTTKAYMNIIGKSLQKGLNSINGVDGGGLDTLESDDEEESRMGDKEDEDESRKKCGALSLAEAFIRDDVEDTESATILDGKEEETSVIVELGLRHCSFDTRAAEALAAVLQESREKYPGMTLSMDMAMNHVLEDETIAALHGEEGYDDQLVDMAEVYLDALEVMREARERALKAARMAAARAKAQSERESGWGAPPPPSSRRNSDAYGGVWSEDEDDWNDSITADDYERNLEEDYSDDDW